MSALKKAQDADGGQQAGTLELLERIQAGSLDPKCISMDDRRQVVAWLIGEGYSTAEVAKMLKVAERTIERDRRAIREGNAIEHDPRLAGQFAGALMTDADLAIQQIRRTARAKDTPPAVKVDGHHRCFQIRAELGERLQSMGYLPTAPQQLQAEFVHHAGVLPTIEQLKARAKQLEPIVAEAGPSAEEAKERLRQLLQQIDRAELATTIEEVSTDITTKESEDDTKE